MNQDYKQNYVSLYGKSDDDDDDEEQHSDIHSNKLSLVDKLNHTTENIPGHSPSPSSINNNNNNNVTPNILLEQLAYVDNFLPNLNHDFTDLNNWIFNSNNNNNNNNNNSSSKELSNNNNNNNPFILDEQLAAELSAFADDVFIFPDEDKQKFNNNNNNDNEEENTRQNNNIKKKNSHYLSQRRNTFLTSQYDYSKSRFSSRRDNNNNNNNNNNNSTSTNIEVSTFSPDVVDSPMINNNTNVTCINNLTKQNSSSSLPSISHIQVPDYSKIPTESLVALLPRVPIPTPVNDLLIHSGFSNDQIVSLSAIMAYHQQQKMNNSTQAVEDCYDKVTLQNRLNRLNDTNPVKAASAALLQLIDKIDSQGNKHGSNSKNASKDEILSLIEASNKEVNELKAKLDKREEVKNIIQGGVSKQRLDPSHVYNSTVGPSTDSFKSNGTFQKITNERQQDGKDLQGTIQQLTNLTNSLQYRIQSLESENELLKEFLIRFTGEIGGAERMESIKQQFLKGFPKD